LFFQIAKQLKNYKQNGEALSKILSGIGITISDIWNIIRGKPVEGYIKKMIEEAWKVLENDRKLVKDEIERVERCRLELLSEFRQV
jgi:hypothetical protein